MKATRFLFASALAVALSMPSAAPVSAQPTQPASSTKIAVVDVQRAVAQTEDGLRATATLRKLFDSRQQELNRKQTELQRQREDLDRQQRVLSKESFQKRAEDLQKQMIELQTVYMEYSKELDKKQKELTEPIVERVYATIKRLAGQDMYDVILDRPAAAFVRSDLDQTDRVIQMVNGGGGAPTGGPTAPRPTGPTAPPAPPVAPRP